MANDDEWDQIRREKFSPGEVPENWPPGIKAISSSGLSLLGIGTDGALYWDGVKLQTETKLGKVERLLATTVAISSIVLAAIEVLRFMGYGEGN